MERKTKPTMSKLRLPFFKRWKGWRDGSSAFINASADALILFDKSLNFVRLNAAAEKLTNLFGEDVVGKNILDVVPNIKETGRYDKYLNVIETGKPFSTEDIVPHPKFGNMHLSVRAFKAGNGLGMIISDITRLNSAGEALRDSEEKYRAIVETTIDGIYQVDTSGKFTFINESFANIFGYRREELLGKLFSSLLSVETFPKVKEMVEEVFSGKNVREEVSVQHKDGHKVPVDFSATPLKANGNVIGLTGILRDITERKKAEEMLRQSETRFRELFDNMSSGVAVYEAINEGEDFIFKDFSKAGERIDKIERRDVIGKSVLESFPGAKDFGLLDVFRRVWRTGNSEHHPISLYEDERIVGWRDNYVYKLPSGEVVAIYDDVTERKRAEEELAKSEAKYRSLIDTAGAGVATINLRGELVLVNEGLCRMIGYSQEELLGRSFADFLHPDDKENVLDIFAKGLAGERQQPHLEFRVIHKDGHSVWCCSNPTPIVQGDETIGFSAVIHDITERKKAEEELGKSIQLLNDTGEMAKVGGWELDLATKEVSWTEEVARIHGVGPRYKMSLEEAITFYAPESIPVLKETLKKTAETGEPYDLELLFIPLGSKDKIWVRSLGRAIYSGGKIVKLAGVFQNIDKYKRAQEAVRESEKKYRQLVENMQEGLWLIDKDAITIFVNLRMAEILGYTAEEMLGKHLFEFMDERGIEIAKRYLERRQQGIKEQHDFEFIRKDGTRIYASLETSPITDEAGNHVGALACVADITKRKLAEEALQQSEERFRNVLDNSLDMVYRLNLQTGRYDYVSPSTERILGYSPEEFVAFNIEQGRSLAHPDDLASLDENVIELVSSKAGTASSIEYRIRHKELGYRWVSDSRSVVYDNGNNPVAVVGNLRDITERKKEEEALRESEEKYRLLAENVTDVIWTMDMDLRFTYISPSVTCLRGLTVKEAMAERLEDIFPPSFFQALVKTFEEGMVAEAMGLRDPSRSWTLELEENCKDGSLIWVEIRAGLLRDQDGRPVGLVGVTRNITERKKAENALRESESKFRSVLEHSVDVIYQVNLKTGTYDYVSPSSVEALGYSPEKLIALGFEKATPVTHPDDVEMILEHFNKLIKRAAADDKEPPTIEYRVKHRELGYRWMSDTSSVLCDDKNVPIAIIGNVRDITKRRKAEEALKESEERYRTLVDTAGLAGEGIMIVERAEGNKAVIAFANDTLSGMLGYQREEMMGMPARDLFLPGDRMWLQEKNRKRRKGEALPSHYGVMALRKDGSMLPIEISMGAMRYEDKSATVIYVRDVTERKQAEDSLRKSEERFRSLIENTSEVVLIVDKDAIITYASPSAERVLGYKPEETIGKISFSFIHEDDMPEVMKLYDQTMQNQSGVITAGVRVRHKDGSWRVAEGIGMNLLDNPAIGGIVVNFRDVTERKQAHEELLRHTRQVEALHAIAQTVSQTLELEELLDTALWRVMEVMNSDAGCIYLLDTVEKELVLRTGGGLSDETISRLATIKLNENNVQKMKEWQGGSTPLRDIFEETGLGITAEVKEKEQIQSFAVAPFVVRGQLSGLIAVGNRSQREFSSADMDLLRAVGNQIGIGTQNAMLYEEVQALIRETIDAQETERERICLEVHDGVAQTLVAAFQYLQALEATLPDDTKGSPLLAKATAQVKQAIRESREVINSLQPATLSDLGLVATLRQELKRLGQETGLKIDFKADAIRIPRDIETGLYRIIHEAVYNARKHSNTKHLRVKIHSEGDQLKIEVKDWGKGFDQRYLDRARRRGTGLFSIRKRAELMKGACEIRSTLGEGTTVHVKVPFSAAEISSG